MKTINSLLQTSQDQKIQFTTLLQDSNAELKAKSTQATNDMEELKTSSQEALQAQEKTLLRDIEKQTLTLTTQLAESQLCVDI